MHLMYSMVQWIHQMRKETADSGRSPYYTVKDSTNKDNEKWQMAIVQNKADNAKTWDYAFREK